MSLPAGARGGIARAKLNLFLHVTGRRSDGYHLLDSLVVFPEMGDRLTVAPATTLSLRVTGRFADQAGALEDNLAWRAAKALQRHAAGAGATIALEKRLPVAAGLGGGSADAAAALGALHDLWALDLPAQKLARLALTLGADVPVCLVGMPSRMQGVGDILSPVPPLPAFWTVLVNPGRAVSTLAVFSRLRWRPRRAVDLPSRFSALPNFLRWLEQQDNDLADAAMTVAPEIGAALDALAAQPEVLLARMSGSGATCFGICESGDSARRVADRLSRENRRWWITSAGVGNHAAAAHQTTRATT
ncbi:MAG: 4-(cytidine 5'-diphospho)-2-C-methyl-D-erythritol kinase [Pseudomonadota bacterium]